MEEHIFPFLWMRGESQEILRNEIKHIQECGIQSFCLEARPHPDFCGPQWWQDLEVVVEESKKRGMTFWILDDAHFPTGYANGMLKEKYKEQNKIYLNYNSSDVYVKPGGFSLNIKEMLLPRISFFDIGKPIDQKEVRNNKLLAVLAIRMAEDSKLSEECLDVTEQVCGDWIHLSLPGGAWRIYTIFTTRMGGGREGYINLLDAKSVQVLIKEVYEAHYVHLRKYAGELFRGFFSDEPELGNVSGYDGDERVGHRDMPLPWCAEMGEEMGGVFGVEWKKYLPYLWEDCISSLKTATVRYHYINLVTQRVRRCFSDQIGDWCRERGLQYIGHLVEDNHQDSKFGAGTGHYFRGMDGMSMSGIDVIRDQIVPGGGKTNRRVFGVNNSKFYHYVLGKLGSSCAEIDEKKAGRCMCELYGAYGWKLGVRDMTWIMNHLLSRGVNYFVPHAFSMAQYPDVDCPPHFYAGGNNAQYRDFGELMKYTKKMCTLLSGGRHQTKTALIYQAEAEWVGEYMDMDEPARLLTENQIDFEILPIDAFTSERYGIVYTENGFIINGNKYESVLIPRMEYISEDFARIIQEHPDINFVFLDGYPKGILSTHCESKTVDKEMTLDRNVVDLGIKGFKKAGNTCISLEKLKKLLLKDFLKEMLLMPGNQNVVYYHYRKQGDIFILFNESIYEPFQGYVKFPSEEKIYRYDMKREQWFPFEGQVNIQPYELTVFMDKRQMEIMNGKSEKCPQTGDTDRKTTLDISTGWYVSMTRALQYPEFSKGEFVEVLEPISNKNTKFSGIIRYEKEIILDKAISVMNWKAENVYECARIYVDGKLGGVQLIPPYEIKLEGDWKPGIHKLTIEISTNMAREQMLYPEPPFRLVYDALEPTGMFGKIQLILEEK